MACDYILKTSWIHEEWPLCIYTMYTCMRETGLRLLPVSTNDRSMYDALLYIEPVIRGVPSLDHCWGTGFGPFNLPTCTLLPGRRDHSQKWSLVELLCYLYCVYAAAGLSCYIHVALLATTV